MILGQAVAFPFNLPLGGCGIESVKWGQFETVHFSLIKMMVNEVAVLWMNVDPGSFLGGFQGAN